MPKRRKKKNRSYNTGERGRNWVRLFEDSRDGRFYLEWREELPTLPGEKKQFRRSAVRCYAETWDEAKGKADELAAQFAEMGPTPATPNLDVLALLDRYVKEVTPTKGASKQSHDRRAHRVWVAFFGAQPEEDRRETRGPDTLDRLDWDRFIVQRRTAAIPGWEQECRDTQIAYDLKFLIAVLNWAVGASLLESNPWRTEVRRVQRWEMPREKNPARRGMPDDIREGLITHAPGWQFGAALIIGRETRSRNSSVRQLFWDDLDQERWTVEWREETDKVGRAAKVPLTPVAIEVLKGLPSRAIGHVPVFPSATSPMEPTPAETFGTWLQRAKQRWLAATPKEQQKELRARLSRVGFHSEKRTGVRNRWFRDLPAKVQERIARTNWSTLRGTYDELTVEDMREAMERTPERTDSGSNCEPQLRAGGAEANG